jgi:hypothetical protein
MQKGFKYYNRIGRRFGTFGVCFCVYRPVRGTHPVKVRALVTLKHKCYK